MNEPKTQQLPPSFEMDMECIPLKAAYTHSSIDIPSMIHSEKTFLADVLKKKGIFMFWTPIGLILSQPALKRMGSVPHANVRCVEIDLPAVLWDETKDAKEAKAPSPLKKATKPPTLQ